MAKDTKNDNQHIISAVDEFDYSTQSESYNVRFKNWRKNKNNPYAYSFEQNINESIFVEGQGFAEKSPERAEIDTLSRILYIIGAAFLVALFIDNVLSRLLILILDVLGVDIHGTFFNSVIYGGRTAVLIVLVSVTLLKILVPLRILHHELKMPVKLRYPLQLKSWEGLISTVGMAMVVCVVVGLPSAYSEETKEIYEFFSLYSADFSVWGQEEFLIYTIFDVIIVSVISEFLFRGEMFHALRQFGDVYAVIITSVLSGLMTQELNKIPGVMLISAVSAIGALNSGTILSAITARVIYKMYFMGLMLIEMNPSDNMLLSRSVFMVLTFVAGLIILSFTCGINKHREFRCFANYNAHLSMKKKLILPLKVMPFCSVIIVSIIAAFASLL